MVSRRDDQTNHDPRVGAVQNAVGKNPAPSNYAAIAINARTIAKRSIQQDHWSEFG
jgi:hypothetical protein